MQQSVVSETTKSKDSIIGFTIGVGIMLFWLSHLIFWLLMPLGNTAIWVIFSGGFAANIFVYRIIYNCP